jgi:hypothetical protein
VTAAAARRAAVGAALLALAACARGSAGGSSAGEAPRATARAAQDSVDSAPRPEPARPVPLRIENRHRSDIVVYALRGSVRTRLGTVTAQTSANLTIPATFVGDAGGLSLIADPVGGRNSARSPQFTVRTGSRVIWTVDANAGLSSLGVY